MRIDGGDFRLTWRRTVADVSQALLYGKRTKSERYLVILFCFTVAICSLALPRLYVTFETALRKYSSQANVCLCARSYFGGKWATKSMNEKTQRKLTLLLKFSILMSYNLVIFRCEDIVIERTHFEV